MTTLSFYLEDSEESVTPSTEGTYALNDQHVLEGINHLIEFFRQGPRNQAALEAVLDQVQELENALWTFYSSFDPDTATGKALELLGRLVGEPQLGRSDDEYRAAIRVRVLVNASDGKPAQLYEIANGIFSWFDTPPTVRMYESYPATIDVELTGDMGDVTLETVYRLLEQAKAGGVKLGVTYAHVDADEFGAIWAATDADDTERGYGYGTDSDTTEGGNWASSV
jgi:hypothetical protein